MELRDEFTRRRVKRPRAQVEPPHAFEDWILTAHAHDHCVCICSSLLRRRAHLLVRLPVRHLTRFPAIPHARTPRTLELGVGCATHAHALILLLPSLVAHNFFIERHDERGGKRRRGLIPGIAPPPAWPWASPWPSDCIFPVNFGSVTLLTSGNTMKI